jgi:hypothetical protein
MRLLTAVAVAAGLLAASAAGALAQGEFPLKRPFRVNQACFLCTGGGAAFDQILLGRTREDLSSAGRKGGERRGNSA